MPCSAVLQGHCIFFKAIHKLAVLLHKYSAARHSLSHLHCLTSTVSPPLSVWSSIPKLLQICSVTRILNFAPGKLNIATSNVLNYLHFNYNYFCIFEKVYFKYVLCKNTNKYTCYIHECKSGELSNGEIKMEIYGCFQCKEIV